MTTFTDITTLVAAAEAAAVVVRVAAADEDCAGEGTMASEARIG